MNVTTTDERDTPELRSWLTLGELDKAWWTTRKWSVLFLDLAWPERARVSYHSVLSTLQRQAAHLSISITDNTPTPMGRHQPLWANKHLQDTHKHHGKHQYFWTDTNTSKTDTNTMADTSTSGRTQTQVSEHTLKTLGRFQYLYTDTNTSVWTHINTSGLITHTSGQTTILSDRHQHLWIKHL